MFNIAPSLFHWLSPSPHLIGLIPLSADGGCFGKLCRVSWGFHISPFFIYQFLTFDYLLIACFTKIVQRLEYLWVLNSMEAARIQHVNEIPK